MSDIELVCPLGKIDSIVVSSELKQREIYDTPCPKPDGCLGNPTHMLVPLSNGFGNKVVLRCGGCISSIDVG